MKSLKSKLPLIFAATLLYAPNVLAENLPERIQAPGLTVFLTLLGKGEQVYQCKAGADGKLAWSFREPVAQLLRDGAQVGRHFAGPTWELADGGFVQGKVVGKAPGATAQDIPWLKLEASAGRGSLAETFVIQRLHTQGGVLEGACETEGASRGIAYSADYVFLKK
jgi:hypothetical protein